MDLVDEEERRALVEEPLLARRFDHLAHVLHARRDGREGEERAFQLRGDDLGQGGFAHARRPPEDERGDISRLEEFSEHPVFTHEMFLPDIFVYRAGAQSFG